MYKSNSSACGVLLLCIHHSSVDLSVSHEWTRTTWGQSVEWLHLTQLWLSCCSSLREGWTASWEIEASVWVDNREHPSSTASVPTLCQAEAPVKGGPIMPTLAIRGISHFVTFNIKHCDPTSTTDSSVWTQLCSDSIIVGFSLVYNATDLDIRQLSSTRLCIWHGAPSCVSRQVKMALRNKVHSYTQIHTQTRADLMSSAPPSEPHRLALALTPLEVNEWTYKEANIIHLRL